MSEEQAAPPQSPDATQDPTPPVVAEQAPQEERTFAMLTHLAALSGFVGIPFGNILGPLIIWLIKKDTMPFVNEQGKESMNFQITVMIAVIICIPLMFVLIGLLLLPVVGIAALVLTIIGAVKANNGEHYVYPFAIRLIK